MRQSHTDPAHLALAALCCLLLAACAASEARVTPTPAPPTATAAPRLSLAPCALANGTRAQCGTLSVPEDQIGGAGRTIDLHVTVLPATGSPRAPDPVFFLSGGPGGVASQDFQWIAADLGELNRSRDFVLVDQRGVGRSGPLSCPDPGFEVSDVLTPDGEELLRAFVGRCLGGLPGDPALYTSDMAADDLDDVRAALGYEQVNLYGGSYGATLAQYYALQHPERVRAMFLEGASLLGVPMRERWPITRHEALRRLFAACAEDARCSEQHPELQTAFETVLARVSAAPVTTGIRGPGGEAIVVDRLTLYLLVNGMLLTTDGQRGLPALIDAAYRDDSYTPIASAYAEILRSAGGSLVQVMAWSILCNEDWARADVDAVAAAASGTYFAEESVAEARAYAVACSYLPPGPRPKDYARRVQTAAPTVFRVGELDPQDPIEHIAARETDVPNSRVLLLPGEAHGVSDRADACRFGVMTALFTSGSVAGLDTSCAAEHEPPAFR